MRLAAFASHVMSAAVAGATTVSSAAVGAGSISPGGSPAITSNYKHAGTITYVAITVAIT
jgi:hypothetical protein